MNWTPATPTLSEASAVTRTEPETVAPSAGAVKLMVGGVVSGAVTVSVTFTVFGDPVALDAAMVTLLVYVPGESPAAEAETFTVAAPTPLAGNAASHDAFGVAVHVRTPPPPFEIEIGCAGGSGLPVTPL